VPDAAAAGRLYAHWLRRRGEQGGPLLEWMWLEVRQAQPNAPACGLGLFWVVVVPQHITFWQGWLG
jgi:hypothetical protein